jgi:hypothetical protein
MASSSSLFHRSSSGSTSSHGARGERLKMVRLFGSLLQQRTCFLFMRGLEGACMKGALMCAVCRTLP